MSSPSTRLPRRWLVLILLLDALLTLPFVYPAGAEGDTLRYALDAWHWQQGTEGLGRLFNVDEVLAYYVVARSLLDLGQVPLRSLPLALNWLSWGFGVAATGALVGMLHRYFGSGTALRSALLVVTAPAWWALHLYGNANLAALGFALGALALVAGGDSPRGRAGTSASAVAGAGLLGALALCFRSDIAMIATAALGLLLGATRRPVLRSLIWAAALAILLRLVIGAATGTPIPLVANVGRHVDLQWRPTSLHWVAQNLLFYATGVPAMVFAAVALIALAWRGGLARRTRLVSLAWISPLFVFTGFAALPLTRILIPTLPGLLLPLGAWAAQSPRARDRWLIALLFSAQLATLATPLLLRAAGRSEESRRAGHAHFLGNMFQERARVLSLTRETQADAASFARLRGPAGQVVAAIVGEDIVWYEFALTAEVRGVRIERRPASYGSSWYVATDPESGTIWYLVSPRAGKSPPELLREWGGAEPDTLLYTPLCKRLSRKD